MDPRREMLLHELGEMWDEIGEAEEDRREALGALEEDCLNVYRTKVAQVRQHRARLQREIADSVAEVAAICATIGEPPATVQTACSSLSTGNLKEELASIAPELKEMRRRQEERRRQFAEVTALISRTQKDLNPTTEQTHPGAAAVVDSESESDSDDLTMRRLQELRESLQRLQSEKEERMKKMAELTCSLRSSLMVLGMDAGDGEESGITDGAIAGTASAVARLREIKRSRMQKLQDLVGTMLELWNLMDTPAEEQARFRGVACNIAASEDEITAPGALSAASIAGVETEVVRLEHLKESRMKFLLLKKHDELAEIRRRARITAAAIDTDPPLLILERLEARISEAKDEEFSRREVLERMEKWQAALEEESWLEEYSRNDNRYNVGKGTHLVLRRAEKARAVVGKMPAMAESLMAKVVAWEKERGVRFDYDGKGLLDTLEEYSSTRKEREEERKRQRNQRKQEGQSTAESPPPARTPTKSTRNVTRTLSMGRMKKTG